MVLFQYFIYLVDLHVPQALPGPLPRPLPSTLPPFAGDARPPRTPLGGEGATLLLRAGGDNAVLGAMASPEIRKFI